MYSATNMLAKARGNNFTSGEDREVYRFYYRNIYLKSDHWKFLREEKLRISPCCEKCGTSLSLDVHHKEYRGLYDVKIKDLQTLCRMCHDKTHAKIQKKKRKHTKHVRRSNIERRNIELMRRDPRKVKEVLDRLHRRRSKSVYISDKNKHRQAKIDKIIDFDFKYMNTYVSVHY